MNWANIAYTFSNDASLSSVQAQICVLLNFLFIKEPWKKKLWLGIYIHGSLGCIFILCITYFMIYVLY